MNTILNPDFIKSTSSVYISNADKREKWAIKNIIIDNQSLEASISIKPLENNGNASFHLSFFSAMEFVSQLQIIYMHHYARLEKKTEEAWMIESSFESKKQIADFKNIHIKMNMTRIRSINKYLYCWATHHVTDSTGGLFLIKIKSVMKLPNKALNG